MHVYVVVMACWQKSYSSRQERLHACGVDKEHEPNVLASQARELMDVRSETAELPIATRNITGSSSNEIKLQRCAFKWLFAFSAFSKECSC